MVTTAQFNAEVARAKAAEQALSDRITALEKPAPPPPTGIPPIPAATGREKLRHDFSKDGMGPFRILTYPNDHDYATDPSQLMRQYCRYVPTLTSIHDGYLDLSCVQANVNPAGRDAWSASFVGTFDGAKFTQSFSPPFTVSYCLRLAGGKAAWPGAWVYGTWLNGDLEVPDWPELIGGRVTANLHPGSFQIASQPVPAGWAVYSALVTPSSVSVSLDGVLVGQKAFTTKGPLGLFLDAKVGLGVPDASTGPVSLHCGWVVVE